MAQRVHESIEVQAPLQDVFSYWSNFENFPKIMSNIEEVRMTGQDTSYWKVKGPLGTSVDFDAKTTEMDPNRGIGWNSVDGEVQTSGQVRFEEVATGRTRISQSKYVFDVMEARSYGSRRRLKISGTRSGTKGSIQTRNVPGDFCSMKMIFQSWYRKAVRSPSSEK